MPFEAAQLYEDFCNWWFRKSRWLKRKGSPTSMEVLKRLESISQPFPQNAAEALVWCRRSSSVLPDTDDHAPEWYVVIRRKIARWRHYLAEAVPVSSEKADFDWTYDQLLEGHVSLDEAVRMMSGT